MGEQMFMMKSEVFSLPSVSDDHVGQKICERRGFTISDLSRKFSQILLIVFYGIITG
jgi:hypothetical protein